MRFAVVSLFPEMFTALTSHGVTGRAVERGLMSLDVINPREFATDRHSSVDDRPYGGGPGMVMGVEPLRTAIHAARRATKAAAPVMLMSPQGERLDQGQLESLAQLPALVLVAGRYEGIDERLVDAEIDLECSIGDYVVSGGELPAMIVMDALTRMIPGVLGAAESASQDSFAEGLLDCPHYTRPERADMGDGKFESVPDVLLSGNHAAIRRWRLGQSLVRTWQRRPDLLARRTMSNDEVQLLNEQLGQTGEETET